MFTFIIHAVITLIGYILLEKLTYKLFNYTLGDTIRKFTHK